jgi:hypothetical protein
MRCQALLKLTCSKGHSQSWKCHLNLTAAPPCSKCEKERKDAEKLALKQHEEQEQCEAANVKHQLETQKVQAEIDALQRQMQNQRQQVEKGNALAKMKADLVALQNRAAAMVNKTPALMPITPAESPKDTSSASSSVSNVSLTKMTAKKPKVDTPKATLPKSTLPSSASKVKWEKQKNLEGAVNHAIDAIMNMIGLETVKEKILGIKAKVDLTQRQGVDMQGERFGLVLLGNPGTGKR